MAFSTHK